MPGRTLRNLAGRRISVLSGVGPKLEERLEVLGLRTVLDLIEHYPRRYLDRTKRAEIADMRFGEEATVVGEVRQMAARRTRGGRSLVEGVIFDGTSYLYVSFFNQSWRATQLPPGTEAAFFGRLERYRGRPRMTNPVVDVVGEMGERTGVIVPVYPQSGKAEVSTWQLRRLVTEALERSGPFADPLPEAILRRLGLIGRTAAYAGIHRPETDRDHYQAARRLVFDEFLRMQLGLVARKRAFESTGSGICHQVDGPLVEAFHSRLPFELTAAQREVIGEILTDLAAPRPMHRLLQGDVGSGKTVVALTALLAAVQGGHQGALMAPTEVLAEQHHLSISRLVEGLTVPDPATLEGIRPVQVGLLTNRTPAGERRRMAAALVAGGVDLLIGTHSLIYGGVRFKSLGVAVIDEQHRFGVEQRAMLRGKGENADVLVMTATPIPRTAAMLVYGDLDLSELRELPPGRSPVVTRVVGTAPGEAEVAYRLLRDEVAASRQGYVVCPLVDGTGKVEAKAATEEFERLSAEDLKGLRLGLLHGQLPAREKEAVMTRFRNHDLDVLVATSVIEVGVDVANATVIVVEDADRFGLSQLHQLRGRVGRGRVQSWCFLVSDRVTDDARARMEAMEDSTDGFLLAERDLRIRGAGEVFGDRQAGFSDLRLGRLPRDAPLVAEARTAAEAILDDDPSLARHRQLADEVQDLLGDAVEFLFKS